MIRLQKTKVCFFRSFRIAIKKTARELMANDSISDGIKDGLGQVQGTRIWIWSSQSLVRPGCVKNGVMQI